MPANYKLFSIARKMLKARYKKHRIRVSTRLLDEKAHQMAQIMFTEFSDKYSENVVEYAIDDLHRAFNL